MKQWYASVNFGLEKLIGDMIKASGAQNIKVMDSALIFSCEKELDKKCINNLFMVLSSFPSDNINEAAKKISRSVFPFPHFNGKTFRVVIMDCGKLRAIPQNIMLAIEKNISRQTKLVAHRADPDIEIWLNRRNDETTFFMVRTKKHSSFEKSLRQGELRPDIAEVMLHKAKTNAQSVIVDMFGGWGAIAAAAAESGRYHKILTGDINNECVNYQKARLKNKRNCIVQKWDARNLPMENESVDAIVTDPPWGDYEKINAPQFYNEFIIEAARILRPNGSFIFLTSSQNAARQSLAKYGFTYSHIPLKINGKETFLFCAENAGTAR